MFVIVFGIATLAALGALSRSSTHSGLEFVSAELSVIAASLACPGLYLIYNGAMTSRHGATLGKRWLKIHVVRTDGSPLQGSAAYGRSGLFVLSGFVGIMGLLDPLWCLSDDDRQCVHDKIVHTLVVND